MQCLLTLSLISTGLADPRGPSGVQHNEAVQMECKDWNSRFQSIRISALRGCRMYISQLQQYSFLKINMRACNSARLRITRHMVPIYDVLYLVLVALALAQPFPVSKSNVESRARVGGPTSGIHFRGCALDHRWTGFRVSTSVWAYRGRPRCCGNDEVPECRTHNSCGLSLVHVPLNLSPTYLNPQRT